MPIVISKANKEIELINANMAMTSGEMLGTIMLPSNLNVLAKRLPKPNYQATPSSIGATGPPTIKKREISSSQAERTSIVPIAIKNKEENKPITNKIINNGRFSLIENDHGQKLIDKPKKISSKRQNDIDNIIKHHENYLINKKEEGKFKSEEDIISTNINRDKAVISEKNPTNSINKSINKIKTAPRNSDVNTIQSYEVTRNQGEIISNIMKNEIQERKKNNEKTRKQEESYKD